VIIAQHEHSTEGETMDRDSFKERERALEEGYFRAQDAKLIEQLRQDARLEEIVLALAEHLQVDNPELLRRVIALGVRLDTGPAFLLAPLVQVAWAEAKVTDRERATVLRLAAARSVEAGSPAHTQLLTWLEERPSDALFDAAMEVIRGGLARLPPGEREERLKRIVQACHEVAEASGGLTKILGLGSGVSGEEEALLEAISTTLRGHGGLEREARTEPSAS
jgi:hypothetical protein